MLLILAVPVVAAIAVAWTPSPSVGNALRTMTFVLSAVLLFLALLLVIVPSGYCIA